MTKQSMRTIWVYPIDEIRVAQLQKKLNLGSNAKVVKLLLDNFENGGKQ